MSHQNAVNLENLLEEVRADPPVRSPRSLRPRVLQAPFDAAARNDLSSVINAEFGVEADGGGNSWGIHYTSIPSLISMLENTENNFLRMYGTGGSNDPGEGRYIHTIELPDGLNSRLLPYDKYAYVASFIQPDDQENPCKAADNLAFWRSYGREGTGCSLTVFLPQQELLAVKYGPDATRDSITRLQNTIEHLQKAAERIAGEIGVSPQSLEKMIDSAMQKVRYLYKSEAYSYEKECRIVETPLTIPDKGIEAQYDLFGPSGQQWPKPYINHGPLAVERVFSTGCVITLGPAVPHKEETKDYINHLLQRASLLGPEVRFSEVEYRRSANYH